MRHFYIILLLVAACAGCKPGDPHPATGDSKFHPFPEIPPIADADADPSRRHAVSVRVPTGMRVERKGDSLLVSFPSLEATNLLVGYKMVTGMSCEEKVYREGVAQPHGMSLQSGLGFDSTTNVMVLAPNEIPQAGQEFAFERRITIFETDLPAQHMWSPQSGKRYNVLWERTFRETLR